MLCQQIMVLNYYLMLFLFLRKCVNKKKTTKDFKDLWVLSALTLTLKTQLKTWTWLYKKTKEKKFTHFKRPKILFQRKYLKAKKCLKKKKLVHVCNKRWKNLEFTEQLLVLLKGKDKEMVGLRKRLKWKWLT